MFQVDDVTIGGDEVVLIAGPCSVESAEQIERSAAAVAATGAQILRGGAFKPRTSPYSFQGLGEQGLVLLHEAARRHGLLCISEVMDGTAIELVSQYVDILQVGSRNMQNYALLKQLSRVDKPILLKRGMAATYEELLMAAEYLLSGGNQRVILCERGIRSFEPEVRHTLDLAAVPFLRERCELPIFVDPSHGTGRRELVGPMAQAALAAGADGLMIEVHPDPSQALSDGEQSLTLNGFSSLMDDLGRIAPVFNRSIRKSLAFV